MLEVRFLVEAPENWIRHMIDEDSATLNIMDVKAPRQGVTENFIELSSNMLKPEELAKHLRGAGGVISSDLSKVDRTRVMGTVTTNDCPVCSTFEGLNSFLVSATSRPDKKMEWKLFLSEDKQLGTLCRRLEKNRVKYEILEVTHRLKHKEITSRQEEVLRIALELGYFEFPKKITLEELSKRLGISIGTLSEILRRAEKHIISKYFSPT